MIERGVTLLGDNSELTQLILTFMKVYKGIEKELNSIFPKVKVEDAMRPLYERITFFQIKNEDVEEMKKTLEESGHSNILQQLSKTHEKMLVGFLSYYGQDGEAVYKAFEHAASLPNCSNIIFEDFSTDSLTVKFLIDKYRPNRVLILTLKRRNRDPGVYNYTVELEPVNPERAPDSIRATLEGSLDIDHLLEGLRVFTPGTRIEVFECDPGEGDPSFCHDRLVELVDSKYSERCQ